MGDSPPWGATFMHPSRLLPLLSCCTVTLALGYVRALQMMNITQQARYLSSNSGGSWFNTAFSYQNNTLMPGN